MNQTHLYEVPGGLTPQQCQATVARRAYEKWVQHGCPRGTALQDWLEAETEVGAELDRECEHTAFGWPHLHNQ